MDELRKLRNELLKKDDEYDPEKAKIILDLVDTISSTVEEDSQSPPPPLELLVYTMNSILYPELEYSQLADLIHLLTMAEFWRLRAMSVISSALVYQSYFKAAPNRSTVILGAPEEELLIEHETTAPEWRNIFMQIISGCVETHVQRLWLSDSNTLFWAYWNEYFSILEKADGNDTDAAFNVVHPSYHRLSIHDMDQLLHSMKNCRDFIEGAFRSAEDQQIVGSTLDDTHSSRDRQELPTLDEVCLEMINSYLEYVPPLVQEVHQLFPVKFPIP